MILKNVLIFLFALCFYSSLNAQKINKGTIDILYSPGHPLNSFIPSKNVGGDVDGHFKGDIDKMLTPQNIRMMRTVGLQPISYRLRTELAGEVWHWNPEGKWSDSIHHCGYWISNVESSHPIHLSYGYRLPRRGNTHDQANDDGYSRIDDGDTATFWKSNPYLDSFYTGQPNAEHAQWVVIDLGRYRKINAVKIKWGNPYALSYKVDYAKDNDPEYFDPYEPDIWHPFEKNRIKNPAGDNKIIKISNTLKKVRFIRISFTETSATSDKISNDIRDKLGFSIKEMQVGVLKQNDKFYDCVQHSADHKQSTVYVSSTDCWHTASDLDSNVEQVGVDRFFTDGLTANEPALFPAALLYDTPENVSALMKHILQKKYDVKEIEMGEEPEGQLISPEDYAALYYRLATKIKTLDPAIKMGGPCFASLSSDEEDSTSFTESMWTSRFLNYLKRLQGIHLFDFFSFEWYPFDDLCKPSAPQLAAAPQMLSMAMANIQKVLPSGIPIYLTEYGYSAFEGKTEAEIEGGLMYTDILGKFLESGGSKSFLYGYEPAYLQQSSVCGFGNNMFFGLGYDGKIKYKTASFYIMQMLTHFWAQPSDSLLQVYSAKSNIVDRKKQSLVSAYCLRAPDGRWRVMLINKDPQRSWGINVVVKNVQLKTTVGWKPQKMIQYSKKQYQWVADGLKSYPSVSFPPVEKKIKPDGNIILPPYSFTVIY